nr:hypothetical protein [Gordonia sputi]
MLTSVSVICASRQWERICGLSISSTRRRPSPMRRYFFELTTAPGVLWVKLDELVFSDSGRCLVIDPAGISLTGDVTKAMAVAELPF